ncbi:MAG: hypothetical protein HGA45_19970 [Chloroflexales bacterium]|nr:hypothetical protein [Chloroflexales bacterium]
MSPPTSEADIQVLQGLLAAPDPVPTPPPGPAAPGLATGDEIYLRVWEIEQEHGRTRWTVATFYLSISFAIFGFSFQAQLASPLPSISRVSAVCIYWFGVLLFSRFHVYNHVLRQYLREMEQQGHTSVKLHTGYDAVMRTRSRPLLAAGYMLIYFGLFYTVGVLLLLWLLP